MLKLEENFDAGKASAAFAALLFIPSIIIIQVLLIIAPRYIKTRSKGIMEKSPTANGNYELPMKN